MVAILGLGRTQVKREIVRIISQLMLDLAVSFSESVLTPSCIQVFFILIVG